MNKFLLLTVLIFSFLSGCKKDDAPGTISKRQLKGFVEKGPFVRGAKVVITALDKDLNPTGRTFEAEIQSDEGFFELADIELASSLVQVNAKGHFFNEVTGKVSQNQISLDAIANIDESSSISVNLLTHLESKRVKYLISKENKSFAEARQNAHSEVLKAFYIDGTTSTQSDQISLAANNRDADVLVAVSATLLNGTDPEASLVARLADITANIEVLGKLNAANDAYIKASIFSLSTNMVRSNLIRHYESLGRQITLGDLSDCFSLSIEQWNPLETYESNVVALKGAMALFSSWMQQFYLFEALYSQSTDPGEVLNGSLNSLYNHRVSVYDSNVDALYGGSQVLINRYGVIAANAMISADPRIRKLEYVVYPYIAYIYWSMMELWGDVPYFSVNASSPPSGRVNTSIIRADLIAKLERSVDNAFTEANDFQFNREMALALLIRLSLQEKDYEKVKMYATRIVQPNKYHIVPLSELHSTSKETILGYKYSDFEQYGNLVSRDYKALISKGDFVHAVRYTEVVLAMAEACAVTGDLQNAQKYLNQVRIRNNKEPLNSLDARVIVNAVIDEVYDDLRMEGLWFSMLKRHSLAAQRLNIAEYQLLLPFNPSRIRWDPNIIQNPGY